MALRRRKKNRDDEEMKLNITSMMDMFTIILIFLLKSYSVSPVNITPNDNLSLPTSISKEEPEEGVSLLILKNKIVLNKDDVAPLVNGIISTDVLDKSGRNIIPLANALKTAKGKTDRLEKLTDNYEFKGTIIIQADRTIPFKTLKKVLFTTGLSGFRDFKFVVMNDE